MALVAVTGLAIGAAAAAGVSVGLTCTKSDRPSSIDWRRDTAAWAREAVMAFSKHAAWAHEADNEAPVGRRQPKSYVAARPTQPYAMEEEDQPDQGWQGFSMEEALLHANEGQAKALSRTPAQVLEALQRGNTRFWMNVARRPERSAFERRALISKQFPSVAILGCSDSRVPTEIVFDQGLGDIFVVRVAGNCLDTATLASLQFAVHHLKVKVLLVLGHELCGAVKAAMLPQEVLEKEPPQLEQALKSIKAGLNQERFGNMRDSRALDRESVTTNVKQQVERLRRDKGIMDKVRSDELLISGGFYEISSGIVDFF